MAKLLARERPGFRLCPDEWMSALDIDIRDSQARNRIEQLQHELAGELLRCGTTAIVEWGTWSRDEREQLRRSAAAAGARTELIVLDPPAETLWQRVVTRALEDPPLRREDLEGWHEVFQRPDASEVARYDSYTYIDS